MMIKQNFYILIELLKRDIKLINSNFFSILIDDIILYCSYILWCGYFLPAFGMPKSYSLPLFLGAVIIPIISIAFTKSVNFKSDIEFKKIIDFHLILPISKNWLLMEYIISFVYELILSSFPLLIAGIITLNGFNLIALFKFSFIYLISIIFISLFFLSLSVSSKFLWFISNIWERVLTPLIHLGCILYIWSNLMKFSNFFGQLVLLNPITYISEGFRSSLLSNGYIPLEFCLSVLTIVCIVLFFIFKRQFNKFLDTV